MTSAVPRAELREMPQNQRMKIKKQTLIESIREPSDDGRALNPPLYKKLEEVSKEILNLKPQLSSPEFSQSENGKAARES